MDDASFQVELGFWRRIELHPGVDAISAGLEDDFHRFTIRLLHSNGCATALETRAERIPWSTCADAGAFLADQFVGMPLEEIGQLDMHIHCTHLFELLILAARHVADARPTRFDVRVTDRVDGRVNAAVTKNGRIELGWRVRGTEIDGPEPWAGRDLRRFSQWRHTLDSDDFEHAMLLRRAVHISNGRGRDLNRIARASDRDPRQMGACFTYRMPRALDAVRPPDWQRDFAERDVPPLTGYRP